MDVVVSIYICPLGAALAGIMFFLGYSARSPLSRVKSTTAQKKPIGSWFYILGSTSTFRSQRGAGTGIKYGGIG